MVSFSLLTNPFASFFSNGGNNASTSPSPKKNSVENKNSSRRWAENDAECSPGKRSAEKQQNTVPCAAQSANAKLKEKSAENPAESGGWFWQQTALPWWLRLAIWIVKLGPIPRHIAFVMDGNRRYARIKQCASVLEGHNQGFQQLTKVLDWCERLGVQEVSVYAFSIENFKRSEEEVHGLMELAERKFTELLQNSHELVERQLRVRFFGNRQLLPENIQQLVSRIEALNEGREFRTTLNICLAYTSSDELLRAMETIRREVQSGQIGIDDIDEHLIQNRMDTRDSLPLDMLIRTSEKRLSDFMLYQIQPSTHLHFVEDTLWPQFSLWHLLKAVLAFQCSRFQLRDEQCGEKRE